MSPRARGALCAIGVLAVLGAAACRPDPACPRPPVVMVRGFGGSADVFAPLIERLGREGYDRADLVALDLPDGVPIEAWGERVAATARRLRDRSGCRVDLVGYSMGGLAARWAAGAGGAGEAVQRVVTLGTPHGGTPLARTCDAPACAQMRAGSAFLRDLAANGQGPGGPPVIAIASLTDAVVPLPSARLSGAANVTLCCFSHRELLSEEKALDAVREALGGGGRSR